MAQVVKRKLGEILVTAGVITQGQVDEALAYSREHRMLFGGALIALGFITEGEIIDTVSAQTGIPKVDLAQVTIDAEAARSVPAEIARKYNLIPTGVKNGMLMVAMSDPLNLFAIDDVRFITKKNVEVQIAGGPAIANAIEIYYTKQATDKAIAELKREYNIDVPQEDDGQGDEIQNAPVVRLTESILSQAISMGVSDIHVEPFEKTVLVRYRIDGTLTEALQIPVGLYPSVCTRLKIMSDMDIAERRLPQDGRIEKVIDGKNYDLRVSSLPTVFGEKIVIRVLDRSTFSFSRSSLGLSEKDNALIDRLLRIPYGIVLMTGPTGSGKTTTLYTLLSELNSREKNIITVEDPVEYMFDGINQVQVNPKAGLTFAQGLRSLFRQDPDIMMVGEIRDEETAQMAVRAAITGHLVLSTVHTNDAPGAVTRLLDMKVDSYLVADAIVGAVAQRLVRRLCSRCKREAVTTPLENELLRMSGPSLVYEPVGCAACGGTGFRGRIGVFEVMIVESAHREAISAGKSIDELRGIALSRGMTPLIENGRKHVLDGVTSPQEMIKSVYSRL